MMEFPDGVHVALITPLDETQNYAQEVMEKLLISVKPRVQGISILGTTGEGPSLSDAAKRVVIRHVVKANNGMLPISCGVVSMSAAQGSKTLWELAEAGINAGLVFPPFYYPLTSEEVLDFYWTVAEATPIPILIYYIPQFTKVVLTPAQVAMLAGHPKIIGIKDSSMNFGFFQRVRQAVPEAFKVFTGSDDMLVATSAVGGNGAICASPNVAPQLATGIWQSLWSHDRQDVFEQQTVLTKLVDAIRDLGGVRAWKAAVETLNFGTARPALPLQALGAADRSRVAEAVANMVVT